MCLFFPIIDLLFMRWSTFHNLVRSYVCSSFITGRCCEYGAVSFTCDECGWTRVSVGLMYVM